MVKVVLVLVLVAAVVLPVVAIVAQSQYNCSSVSSNKNIVRVAVVQSAVVILLTAQMLKIHLCLNYYVKNCKAGWSFIRMLKIKIIT